MGSSAAAFSGHRSSGYAGIVVGLLMVVAVEVLVVHLLVATWSHAAAWTLTALGVYGAVWLLGDLQATRLRPTWLHDDQLCLRLGLALPGARRVLIELSEPAEAVGIYGIRRTVTTVEVGVDEPDRLIEALG